MRLLTILLAMVVLSAQSGYSDGKGGPAGEKGRGTTIESMAPESTPEAPSPTSLVKENNQFFVGFGPATLVNLDANDVSYQFIGGKLWPVSHYISLKATGEATTDFDKAVLTSGKLGMNLYPILSKYAPYIGGNMGVGYSHGSDASDLFGFEFAGVAGVELFRTSNKQVSLESQADILARDFTGNRKPMSFAARLGVLF